MPVSLPMQRVEKPLGVSRFCISYSKVVNTRAPDAPMGLPSATGSPQALTLFISQPIFFLTPNGSGSDLPPRIKLGLELLLLHLFEQFLHGSGLHQLQLY